MKAFIRKIALVGLLISIGATCRLQAQVAYSHTITDQGYGGLKFRYKASVRTIVKNQKGIGFMVDFAEKEMDAHHHHQQASTAVRKFVPESAEWTAVLLEGTLPEHDAQIDLVIIPMGMGDYFLDDLNFEVLTADNQWKSIYQTGFEKGMAGWEQGMGKARKFTNSLFTSALSDKDPKSGKQSLMISGKFVVDYSDKGSHDWAIDATYGESCSCESVCPCISGMGEMPAACIGNNVITIHSGHYDDVNLDGLKIMMAFRLFSWSIVYIDERATAAQQEALMKLLWKIPTLRNYLAQQKGVVQRAPVQVVASDSSFAYSVPNSYAKINYIFLGADSTLSLNNLEPDDILFQNTLGLSEKNVHTGDKYAFEYEMKNGVVSHFKVSSKDKETGNKN